MLKKRFPHYQFLQLAANFVFSALVDVCMFLLTFWQPEAIWVKGILLLVGCVILASGIVLQVAPNVLVLPSEGFVKAMASSADAPLGNAS